MSRKRVGRMFTTRRLQYYSLCNEMHENITERDRIEVPNNPGRSCCEFICFACFYDGPIYCGLELLEHCWEKHQVKVFLDDIENYAYALAKIKCEACGKKVLRDSYTWNAHLRYEHMVPMEYLVRCVQLDVPVSVFKSNHD